MCIINTFSMIFKLAKIDFKKMRITPRKFSIFICKIKRNEKGETGLNYRRWPEVQWHSIHCPHYKWIYFRYPLDDANEDLARLCYNENPYGPSESARAAIMESMKIAYQYPFAYIQEFQKSLVQTQ